MERTRRICRSLLIAVALFYLMFHALHGEQGLYALLIESRKKEQLQAELDKLKAEHAQLEHKVTHLRSANLDPDLLDEQARRLLGYSSPDEIVVVK